MQYRLRHLEGADRGRPVHCSERLAALAHPQARLAGRLTVSYAELALFVFTYAQERLVILETAHLSQLVVLVSVVARYLLRFTRRKVAIVGSNLTQHLAGRRGMVAEAHLRVLPAHAALGRRQA